MKLAESTIHVSRTTKVDGTEYTTSETPEVIEVHKFPDGVAPSYAKIGVNFKKAHNYNSAGITVGVDLACYTEDVEATLARGYTLCVERAHKELPSIITALESL